MKTTVKSPEDMKNLSVSERARVATALGEEVGKIMDKALARCNKILKKYGYSVSVTLNFHELGDEPNDETSNERKQDV